MYQDIPQETMTLGDILELPVAQLAGERAHLYLWVPNALLSEGLEVMRRWGFTYKTNLVWHKVRKDGGPDIFASNAKKNELSHARTLQPGRRQVNLLATRKREHSRSAAR